MASVKFRTFPSVDFSKFDLPKFDVPKVDLPKFDLSKFELPKVDPEAVANVAKDVAYVGIGAAVLAFQKAQILRRDAAKSLNERDSRPRPARRSCRSTTASASASSPSTRIAPSRPTSSSA